MQYSLTWRALMGLRVLSDDLVSSKWKGELGRLQRVAACIWPGQGVWGMEVKGSHGQALAPKGRICADTCKVSNAAHSAALFFFPVNIHFGFFYGKIQHVLG